MTPRKRIIIIGGSAAGPKAAAKARRIDNNAEVIILQKDADLSMASCGYPYYVGGCQGGEKYGHCRQESAGFHGARVSEG